MPICPKCNTTIHSGAEDQCPACGYSLQRADAVFGRSQVEFTRIVDAAGALTHRERMDLLHTLEDLERNIPPVALCIYITDHGEIQEFRSHAHWILNHAKIHHPSFGKREKARAIEDAELTERKPGEARLVEDDKQPGLPGRICQKLRSYVRNSLHPLPPPARQEWMLILALDVQLELACFSWGYMLDPYINPDKITSCIISARLQFRERAMVTALKRVMTQAVRQIALASHKVNKTLKRSGIPPRSIASPPLAVALCAALLSAVPTSHATPSTPARPPMARASNNKQASRSSSRPVSRQAASQPAIQFEDDDTAEEAEPASAAPLPASAAQAVRPSSAEPASSNSGAAATYASAPRWTEEDYKQLMAGNLTGCYNLLARSMPASRNDSARPVRPNTEESDTKVPGRYCDLYSHPGHPSDLYDPQMLLSDIERSDVAHELSALNAHAPYRIYVSIFKEGQEIPSELAAGTLVTAASQPCEYAVMLQYSIGDNPAIDLGYKEISPSDEQRREWALSVRNAAVNSGGGVEGLLSAIRQIHANINPVAAGFRPITPESAGKARLIDLPMKEKAKEKEPSARDKLEAAIADGGLQPLFYALGGIALCGLLFLIPILHYRRSGRLLDSPPDYRLSSPYGAGVSRYVRYLEGKEAAKEKTIF